MKIALGLDLSDRYCAANAIPVGKSRKLQNEFIEEFNREFRRVKTEAEELRRMAKFLLDGGNDVFVLIENSTITHKVYWILLNAGCNVTVAQSADLKRITESVTKNDDNDAFELAHYMRRRLNGEKEFAVVMMSPPEIMSKKMFIRAIYADKEYLADAKRRTRARIKIMGADLKDYVDICCKSSILQLRSTKDPFLIYQTSVMRATKSRITESEKYIFDMFRNDRYFGLILSIPGFGIPLSAYISTIVVDIGRFDGKRKMEAYFGLVPKQRSSADSDPDCRTTHHGDRHARDYLAFAVKAHVLWCEDSVITEMYHRLRSRHKPYKKVITACSRKMIDVIWSVLKNDRPFTTDKALLRSARGAAEEVEKTESELFDDEIDEMYENGEDN